MLSIIKQIIKNIVNFTFTLMVAFILVIVLRDHFAQPFQVEGKSMNPTLYQGDHLIMLKQTTIERFDIVVFPDPMGSEKTFVKRLIGLPGDRLEVKGDQLYINDQVVAEPYLDGMNQSEETVYTEDFTLWQITGDQEIPPGKFFVLGDNRPESGDSRQFGYVDAAAIEGKAVWIYYPWARWSSTELESS